MVFDEEYLQNKKNVRKQQNMYEMCFNPYPANVENMVSSL